MNHQIAILHRAKTKKTGSIAWGVNPSQWVLWETCLRQVYFGSVSDIPSNLPDDVEIYRGKEAYQFCLHTVCGLKSPMVGETEVWGQFKSLFREFSFTEHIHGSLFRSFVDHIFADGKQIRHKHLTGLGSQSYGSLARRILKGSDEINIIGSGLLVKDMLPWLVKSASKIRIFCRNIDKGLQRVEELKIRPSSLEVHSLENLSLVGAEGGLVVAAPVTAKWIEESFSEKEIKKVVDLRDNSTKDRVQMDCVVIPLVDFFNEIESTRKQVANKVSDAEKEIKHLIEKRFNQITIRPYGWDDLWL